MALHKIENGLDLPIPGKPIQVIRGTSPCTRVALVADDYPGMKPRMHVAEGDTVKRTGRIADVIYHEFGHGTHYNAIVSGSFDGAVSEGASDYLSATMNDDSALAPGFFGSTTALRDADNDKMYPQHLTGEVHADGEIYVAAVWHLRESLLLRHGRWIGTERADAYWYATLQGTHNMSNAHGHWC